MDFQTVITETQDQNVLRYYGAIGANWAPCGKYISSIEQNNVLF